MKSIDKINAIFSLTTNINHCTLMVDTISDLKYFISNSKLISTSLIERLLKKLTQALTYDIIFKNSSLINYKEVQDAAAKIVK